MELFAIILNDMVTETFSKQVNEIKGLVDAVASHDEANSRCALFGSCKLIQQ